MLIKLATFNLFQFCEPTFSFYTKKEKFKPDDWTKKISFIKEQLNKIDPEDLSILWNMRKQYVEKNKIDVQGQNLFPIELSDVHQ